MENSKATLSLVYSCGLIGCGFIGVKAPDSHFQAYLDCADTELVAVCDLDIKRVRKFAPRMRWQHYDGMVEYENLDIVSVCTPVETHCKIVCDIAPYVKAIYCEKPMATTMDECDKMIETCHKNKVILQINHQRRFSTPKFRFSRDIIDTGTHVFDLLRKLFGEGCHVFGNIWSFGGQWIGIEYIPTEEHIFELDCVRSKERMILHGVEHLVNCLKTGSESISSGEDGREALRLALLFKEMYEANN